MKIKAIKVGAHRYAVEVDSPHLTEDGDWAQHSGRRRRLDVDTRDRPASAVAEDLVHEIVHALFLDAGSDIDRDEEEAICTMLGPRLTAFLADNPDAVRELLRMLK